MWTFSAGYQVNTEWLMGFDFFQMDNPLSLEVKNVSVIFKNGLCQTYMVKYRAVSFKKDQIAALYFTMSDIVHAGF